MLCCMPFCKEFVEKIYEDRLKVNFWMWELTDILNKILLKSGK